MAITGIVIRFFALLFGLAWIWINVYNFYPIVRHLLGRASRAPAEWTAREESSNLEADGSGEGEEASSPRPDGGTESPFGDASAFDALPSVDLFVPAYDEGSVIEQAISSARASDYPQELLNLVVLLEPDDDGTRSALDGLAEKYDFDTITVPEGYPGESNKPRALNYGFERTSSDIVGVLDAEELLASDMVRRVAARLTGEFDFAQGKLDMVNEDDGWLNTMFRAEYGYWYETSLAGFTDCDYPIPMAGTTCFFDRDVLEEMSVNRFEQYGDPWSEDERSWVERHGLRGVLPWDPSNVTEDFELGLFLWQKGYRFAYVDSTTKSESPLTLDSWIKQRTRWQKGKVYTFKQYLKTPPEGLFSKIHLYTQSAIPHIGAINFAAALIVLLGANLVRGYTPRSSTMAVLNVSLLFGVMMMGLYSYGYWTTSDSGFLTRLRRAAVVFLSLPAYWLIQWIADLRALRQVYTGQLHWSKTTHIGRNVGDAAQSAVGLGTENKLTLDRKTRWGSLLAVLVTGVAMRLYRLDSWSLYADEIYSVYRARLPVMELITVPLTIDSHPPGYYLLLHYWMELFGTSTFDVRTLTVSLAALTLVGIYWLGKELYDDRVGLIAALLYAVSTFYVHFGRVARMYSLVTFLTICSWYGFVRLQKGSRRATVGYLLATTLLVYTHVYAVFVIAAQNLYAFLTGSSRRLDLRFWTTVQGALALFASPWLALLLMRALNLDQAGSLVNWIPEPDGVRSIIKSLSRYVGYPLHYPLLQGTPAAPLVDLVNPWDLAWQLSALLLALFIACAIFAVVRYRSDGTYELTEVSEASQLAILFLSPILLPFVISYLVQPIYWTRYTVPASIGFVLLVAKGIRNVSFRRAQIGIVAFILVCSAFMGGIYYTQSSVEDWNGAASCLQSGTEDGDLIVYQSEWIGSRIDYYGVGGGNVSEDGLPDSESITGSDLSNLRNSTAGHDEVWLLRYHPGGAYQGEDRVVDTINDTHTNATSTEDGAFSAYRFYRNDSVASSENENMSSICPQTP